MPILRHSAVSHRRTWLVACVKYITRASPFSFQYAKRKQMSSTRARAFQFTWNNYSDDHQDRLDEMQPRYVCYGYEWAPVTGTPHLQGYIYFDNARTHRSVCRQLQGVHVEVAKGTFPQNRTYCSKGGEFVEFGDPPKTPQEIGQAEANRYEVAWDSARRGKLNLIPRRT